MAIYKPRFKKNENEIINVAMYGATHYIEGTGTTAGTWLGSDETITAYYTGLTICYKVPVEGASSTTLNINSLGAKKCYYASSSALTTRYGVGNIILFVYDETLNSNAGGWRALADYDTNTESNAYLNYNNNILAKSELSAYNIVVADNEGYFNLKTGNTFCIDKPILYRSTKLASGSNSASNSHLAYGNIAISNTQSITLTIRQPIYIKGTLNGRMFTPISTTPLTQTLPTNEDGYAYIVLGVATSTTGSFALIPEHKIFEYKNGQVQLYTPPSASSGGSSKWEYLESADIVGGNSIDLTPYHNWNELLILINNANGVENDQACIGTDNLDFLFDITTAGNQMWIRAEKDNQELYLLTVGGMVVGNYRWYDGDELNSIYITSNTTTQNDHSIEIGITIYGR